MTESTKSDLRPCWPISLRSCENERLWRTGLFGLTPGASGGGILAKMKDWARFDRVVRGLMLAGAGFGR
jgi:hypothetical protein